MSVKTGMCEATSELDDECYYVKDDENDEILYRATLNKTRLLLTKSFEIDTLSQFVTIRQLYLQLAYGSVEEYNAEKRTI